MSTASPSGIRADPLAKFRGSEKWWTPSNAISGIRVLMVVPAVFAIVEHYYPMAAIVFLIAFASDLLDGYIARKFGDVSELGKIIDPLADKIFVGSVVSVMLLVGLVPLWFVAAVLVRDIIIFIAGIWSMKKLKVVLPSNYAGKTAVLAISLTLFFLMIGVSRPLLVFMEYLCLILMVLSLMMYAKRLSDLLRTIA